MESPFGILSSIIRSRRVTIADDSGVRGTGLSFACRELVSRTRSLPTRNCIIVNESECITIRSPLWLLKSSDDVGAFPRGDHHILHADRFSQQPLIRADLRERLIVRKRQMKEPAIGSVQHAKSVFARLYIQIREQLAVDQHGLAGRLGNPRRAWNARDKIIEPPVLTKGPVADHQRNLVLAPKEDSARLPLCRGR